jgi:hypothetical protein
MEGRGMKAGLVLIGHYYIRRLVGTALGLLLMVVVAAAVVFMGMLWPAFRFHHTASASSAEWDVHVNGPLSQEDVEAIKGVIGPDGRVESANRGAIRRVSKGTRAVADPGDLYAADPLTTDHAFMWTPEQLVLKGSMADPHAAGIDWVTARRIGAGIGDTITFSQVYSDPSGLLQTHSGSARISAILATTANLRGVVMQSSPELQETVRQTVGILATDLFAESESADELVRQVSMLPGAENWTVQTRNDYQRASVAAAENAGAHAYGATGLLVAAVMLFVVMLRDLFVRMGRRRSACAVLYSVGQRSKGLLGIHLLEQLALVGGVSAAGYLLGTSLLVDQIGLYPPAGSRGLLFGVWSVCVAVLALTCAWLVHNRMNDRSLIADASDWRG